MVASNNMLKDTTEKLVLFEVGRYVQIQRWFSLCLFYARIIHRSVLGGLTDRLKMTEEDLRKAHRVITKDHF